MERRKLTESLPPDAQEFVHGSNKVSKPVSQQANQEPEEFEPTVALTVRYPFPIVKKLRERMTARKNARRKPFTQQEIVVKALEQWLEENA